MYRPRFSAGLAVGSSARFPAVAALLEGKNSRPLLCVLIPNTSWKGPYTRRNAPCCDVAYHRRLGVAHLVIVGVFQRLQRLQRAANSGCGAVSVPALQRARIPVAGEIRYCRSAAFVQMVARHQAAVRRPGGM